MKTLKDLQHHLKRLEAAIDKLADFEDDFVIETGRNNLRFDFVRTWKPMPFASKANKRPPISIRPNYLLQGKQGVSSQLHKELTAAERNIEVFKRKAKA